ncbi:hypothetical protein N0V84_010972 [Fusarium piperis]|uniref:Endonuclease/exonuclease/phosphatase domain-containing protein n=1 Tax=Fusarium piperis TaxID=1435070 RepID=A0A9W8TCU6_9HYPO|nr:hypothetical protein N0V84_010972 [Fusarium piperis]
MRFASPLIAVTSALWLTLFPSVQAQSAEASGSLSLIESEDLFTFRYSTSQPDSSNWVGLYYSAGGGPVNGEKGSSNSIMWKWTPNSQGTVQLSASILEPGNYTAFFLARGGYQSLAEPLEVVKPRETGGDVAFIVSDITLPKARVGDRYAYRLSGLVKGGNHVTFSTQGYGSWLKITEGGVLAGVPPAGAKDTVVTVRATGTDSATIGVFTVPVVPKGEPLIKEFKVMSLNMWNGGTGVTNYHDKQVRFLASSGADIIGIQEDQSGRHIPRLANALGWYGWSSGGDVGILSKYPIEEEYGVISGPSRSGGVRIALDGDRQQLNFYVAHLGYTPYGPYDFCFSHMDPDRVIQREAQSGRTPQMEATLLGMKSHLDQADETPVFLVGDFNAPSHLDWVDGLKEKNCGYSNVRWPTSVLPEEAGLIDSFRVANPDPVKVQGITWSPVTIWNNANRREPQDRIDFILHKGKSLKVTDSHTVVVGDPLPIPDTRYNEWFSDHAAVLTTYKLE